MTEPALVIALDTDAETGLAEAASAVRRGAVNLPYQVGNILLRQYPADVDLFLQRIGNSQLAAVKNGDHKLTPSH